MQEPPCRICTRLTTPAAFIPRTLESRYKSPVTRRREYCEPRRCNAKVGTDLKSEFDSRFCNVDCIVSKIQELKRNVQDHDTSKRHDKPRKIQEGALSLDAKITSLKEAYDAMENCLREIGRVKTFLEDENSWWKILKDRSVDCCQQKLPHLHGVLDGSSVTLMLLEEGADEAPRRFVTSTPKKRSDVAGFNFGTSSATEVKHTEQYTNSRSEPMKEYTDSYATPYYSLDMKSALIEVASIDKHEPTHQYGKTAVMSKQSSTTSEFWTEVQEDKSDKQRVPEKSPRSKETRDKIEDKEKRTDKSNIVPPREIWYGRNTQTIFEDAIKPRETFSSENTGSKRHVTADFESNVDLNTEIPSRNMASHKPRAKMIIEKGVYYTQKLPTKIPRIKSRD